MFSGFYAIVAATDGNFDRAGIAIFIAMVLDGLDGRIARWTRTQSEFGKEYDSLSDMVAFGLAPAVVAYQWGVARIAEYGFVWGRLGWLATFFYAACAGIRLARFNSRADTADKRFFEGLPSPSGAALLAGFVWMLEDLQREALPALVLAFIVAFVAGALMVSRFRYLSGKDLDPKMRVPVAFIVLIPLGFVLRGLQPARGAVRPVRRVRELRSLALGVAPRAARPACRPACGSGPRPLKRWSTPASGLPAGARRGRVRAARRAVAAAPEIAASPATRNAADAVPVPVAVTTAPTPATTAASCDDLGWDALRAAVAACQRCELHATRTQTVFGVGNPRARWMFIGEAPGAEEDAQGEPFVGRAGQLLTAMIRALGMKREDVYIANVLKCRPPGNRDPKPSEAVSCRAFLERQVALVDPTLVIAVGRIAAQDLLATQTPIAKLRGKVHSFGARAWPLIVTYHPAYLLRSPGEKRKSWQDLVYARQHFARLEREAATAERA